MFTHYDRFIYYQGVLYKNRLPHSPRHKCSLLLIEWAILIVWTQNGLGLTFKAFSLISYSRNGAPFIRFLKIGSCLLKNL
jgi:hypothetical protein